MQTMYKSKSKNSYLYLAKIYIVDQIHLTKIKKSILLDLCPKLVVMNVLTLKAPITTAADGKFFNIFTRFLTKIKYDIS